MHTEYVDFASSHHFHLNRHHRRRLNRRLHRRYMTRCHRLHVKTYHPGSGYAKTGRGVNRHGLQMSEEKEVSDADAALDQVLESLLMGGGVDAAPSPTTSGRLPDTVSVALRREVRLIFESQLALFRTQMAVVMRQELCNFRVELQRELTAVMRNSALSAARSVNRHVQNVANGGGA